MPNLSNMAKFLQGIATTAAGTSTINGDEVDMQNFEGCFFILKYGTPAADNEIKAQQDDVTGMAGAADLEGTLVTPTASPEGELWLDIYRPLKRFIRMVALRGTSTTIDWGIAIRYGAKKGPQDNNVSGLIAGELHASPSEGTA